LAKVRRGGHTYYLEVAGNGRREGGIEAPGEWRGPGSAQLALEGTVTADNWAPVLAGSHPQTGERLGVAHERVAVVGLDLSFCAPKSVSLLHALGSAEVATEVRAGHDAAVEAALGYVDDRVVAVRRPRGDVRIPVRAEAVATAAFVHRVSRALDPHLHTGQGGRVALDRSKAHTGDDRGGWCGGVVGVWRHT
jgi:conjugative relaxase-like TrwC/TraI family protein